MVCTNRTLSSTREIALFTQSISNLDHVSLTLSLKDFLKSLAKHDVTDQKSAFGLIVRSSSELSMLLNLNGTNSDNFKLIVIRRSPYLVGKRS